MVAKKQRSTVVSKVDDPLTIPSFLLRKAWSTAQHKAHQEALARYPITHLGTTNKSGDFKERKAMEAVCLAVERALRHMPFEAQELAAREVLPLFGQGLSLDELRLMVDDRLPGALKDEEEDDRLRGSARERVAQDVAIAVGKDALTLHELRKRLPGLDVKALRSGLRRALATSLLFQRKDGGRLVYSTVAGRAAVKAVEGEVGQTARKPRSGSKTDLIAALLLRAEGCTTEDVLAATGWPSVSMPASAKVSGLTLRKERLPGQPTRYWGSKTQ